MGDRKCGAATLAMVYASLGIRGSQEEIWEQVACGDARGTRSARSYLLARDALDRGLSAVVLQALRPWDAIRSCWESGIFVLLNHRLRAESSWGHFSLLVGIEEDQAVVHDPQLGPSRRLSREQLLRLWLPAGNDSEIAGHILVALGRPKDAPATCRGCGDQAEATARCIACCTLVPLRPLAALGCVQPECRRRLWRYLFCPYCDAILSIGGAVHKGDAAPGTPLCP